jgi:signal transduction histidine kinase/ligand-binding sensor domain-containing protein/DNA-binding response OmpR family regulator
MIGLLATMLSTAASGKNVLFNRLDVNNGLPSNEVSCIYKDKKGFMWFGTSAGIARFDGYEFCTFRHEVGDVPFSEEYILHITETADGNLWITYQDGKVSVFNPRLNHFYTPEEVSAELNIRKVFHDNDGRLLYETTHGELCLFDYETNRRDTFAINRTAGALSDVVLKNHRLYVIHASGQLELLDATRNTPILTSKYLEIYPELRRFYLFVDSEGEIWVYLHPENAAGLFRFRPEQEEWIHYTPGTSPQALTSSLIRDIEEDPDGTIWIATDHGGLNLLNKKTERITPLYNHPFDNRSLSQNSVICLYRDDTDILWCGTYKNGVSYYHESIFKFESIRYPIANITQAGINDFNCVYEEPSGNLWIGTNGHGLLYYERAAGRFRQYRHNPADPHSLSSNVVVCLAGDPQGRLWIGTYMGGLDCFDHGRFLHYSGGEEGTTLANASVYSLFLEGDKLWIGTLGKGLNLLHVPSGRWSRYTASDSLQPLLSDNIYAIARGWNNQLLVGTAVGVNVICTRSGKIRTFDGTKDGSVVFRDKGINTVYVDSHGLLWIGSNNGLSVYDRTNDRLARLDRSSGLPDNAVMSILEDDNHILWLGTKNGLLKIHPRYVPAQGKYDFLCTPYYEDEGVQGRIFNRNSVCHTADGELILGGTEGLTVFHPLQIRYNNNPPDVAVSGLLRGLHKRDLSYENSLSLDYDQRNFTLAVSVLNYFLPSKNRFSYKMEGFDKDWTISGAIGRFVTYDNLPPGRYTFLVRAENNDGMPSPSAATLHISVSPPFWLTPWAFLVYAVMAACFVYLTIKVATNIQKRKFAEKQEQLAASQLHEMDEMKLRFFTNVSHEFRTPLTLIMAPLERLMKHETNPAQSALLSLIHENANQLLTLVNQLLDFRKIDVRGVRIQLSSGDMVLFVRNIIYSFKEMSEQKNIRFSFSSAFPSLMMSFDTDKVFKIVSNLISNAFKFTPEGGEITVSLRLEKHDDGQMSFLVEVADTGIGIAADELERIFNRFYQVSSPGGNNNMGAGIGLHICREYARVHNGSIIVKSEPGKGSVFCLSLPFHAENIHEVVSAPVSAAPTLHFTAQTPESNAKASLLVVDDHTNFRLFMQNSLSETYNVTTAPDGGEAWKIITEELPDIVVADWMMPVMDGIELCKKIKNDMRTSHISVIILTSKSAETGKIDGLEAGADDYIEKPFSLEILQLRIARIIEHKEKMQRHFFRSVQRSIPLTGNVEVSSLDDELIRKTVRVVEAQIDNPSLSVEWLSREMAMSRTNFYKKILAITGKTPVELIRTIRMKYAAQLLENNKIHINEVALRVGVNDHKLFRKYFKEEFGILPSELHRKENAAIHEQNLDT